MTEYRGGLPEDALQVIGLIMVTCGHREDNLTRLLVAITSPLSHSPMVEALIANDSFNTKIDKLKLFA